MKIASENIPQADVLEDVVRTVLSVNNGGRSYQQIANAIGKVDRQGRYYRKAAEILGFIETPTSNRSQLTELGRRLILEDNQIDQAVLFSSVVNSSIFQRLIPFMELNSQAGLAREEIVQFLSSVADLGAASMAPRRVNSVIAWAENIGLISLLEGRYFLSNTRVNNNVNAIQFNSISEPILPNSTNLTEYETVELRTSQAEEEITIQRNNVAIERADNAHRTLVNLIAERIRNAGSIPRYNQLIDLATKHENENFIFEMKSTTPQNAKSQIRKAVSQLYEYQYLQNLPNANLVMVIENPLYQSINWMLEYIESSRNIHLIWDGDGNIYGSDSTKERLDFLNFT